jgi:hypothetical protein
LRESKVDVRREEDTPEASQVIAETEESQPVSMDDLPDLSTATMPQTNKSKQKKNTTSVSYLFIPLSSINQSYSLNSLSYRNGLTTETTFLTRCYTCMDVPILWNKTLASFVRRRMDYIGARIALEGVCSIAQVVS